MSEEPTFTSLLILLYCLMFSTRALGAPVMKMDLFAAKWRARVLAFISHSRKGKHKAVRGPPDRRGGRRRSGDPWGRSRHAWAFASREPSPPLSCLTRTGAGNWGAAEKPASSARTAGNPQELWGPLRPPPRSSPSRPEAKPCGAGAHRSLPGDGDAAPSAACWQLRLLRSRWAGLARDQAAEGVSRHGPGGRWSAVAGSLPHVGSTPDSSAHSPLITPAGMVMDLARGGRRAPVALNRNVEVLAPLAARIGLHKTRRDRHHSALAPTGVARLPPSSWEGVSRLPGTGARSERIQRRGRPGRGAARRGLGLRGVAQLAGFLRDSF